MHSPLPQRPSGGVRAARPAVPGRAALRPRRTAGGSCAGRGTAQETFVRAFFGLRKLRRREAFFPWLLGIARRVVQEQRRHARRPPPDLRACPRPGPAVAAEDAARLERVVADLPRPYQEVVLLRYYGGQSCAQVAASLGLRIGTVTKRLSRAHRRLRQALGESEHEVAP